MTDENVLAFLLPTGKIVASVLPKLGILEIFDKGLNWYQATDIETGETFLLNLRFVEQVRVLPIDQLSRGGNKIIRPGSFISN